MSKWRSIRDGVQFEGGALFFNPSFIVAFYSIRGGIQIEILRYTLYFMHSLILSLLLPISVKVLTVKKICFNFPLKTFY